VSQKLKDESVYFEISANTVQLMVRVENGTAELELHGPSRYLWELINSAQALATELAYKELHKSK
jgi:hypothetical protein